jgi:uncharacterized protein (DUF983 family)
MDATINRQTVTINKWSWKSKTANVTGRQTRIPCPRCIGGNMFRDSEDEYVCIQCGHSYYTNSINNTQITI